MKTLECGNGPKCGHSQSETLPHVCGGTRPQLTSDASHDTFGDKLHQEDDGEDGGAEEHHGDEGEH
jgi:hypothetical protein